MSPPRPQPPERPDSSQSTNRSRVSRSTYLEVPTHRISYSSRSPSRDRDTPTPGDPNRSGNRSPAPLPFPILRSQRIEDDPPDLFADPVPAPETAAAGAEREARQAQEEEQQVPSSMSGYSSSSQDDSVYSSPAPQQYSLVTPGTLNDPRTMSQVSPGFVFVMFPYSLSNSFFANTFSLPIPRRSDFVLPQSCSCELCHGHLVTPCFTQVKH
jgi:hypothetical protein